MRKHWIALAITSPTILRGGRMTRRMYPERRLPKEDGFKTRAYKYTVNYRLAASSGAIVALAIIDRAATACDPSTPEEMRARMASDVQKWVAVIEKVRIEK